MKNLQVVYNLCVFMEPFGDVKTLPLRPGVGGGGREEAGRLEVLVYSAVTSHDIGL